MKVTDIAIDKEQLEELESLLSRQENYFTSKYRRHLIKKYGGGYCFICGNIATKQVNYDCSDSEQKASKVERYCDKHATVLTATNGKDKTLVVKMHKKGIIGE
jgi:hypothetical protein